MKNFYLTIAMLFVMVQFVSAQGVEQGINSRISPPLESYDPSAQIADLEVKLIEANREVDFWRNAHFYNDPKRERERKEKLVFWAQKTVEIRNQMTKLKQNRSFYMHRKYGNQKYYYNRNPKPKPN